MKKYRLHWTLHPEKNMEWYEAQKRRLTIDEIARELDINYDLSVSGRVFHEYVPHRHRVHQKPELDKTLPIYRVWDFGKCNATIMFQVDRMGRKLFFHERVLGNFKREDGFEEKDSNDREQAEVVMRDCEEYDDFEFIDVCDPQGKATGHVGDGVGTSVTFLKDEYQIYPEFDVILHQPTKDRKKNAINLVKLDMQNTPGGREAFQIYVNDNGVDGCPVLHRALLGGYRYKLDTVGNITSRIDEQHPIEDVVDCMLYGYLQSTGRNGGRGARPDPVPVVYDDNFDPLGL